MTQDDHDQVLIDAVAELLGELAKAFKEAFAPHFETLFPLLLKVCVCAKRML